MAALQERPKTELSLMQVNGKRLYAKQVRATSVGPFIMELSHSVHSSGCVQMMHKSQNHAALHGNSAALKDYEKTKP